MKGHLTENEFAEALLGSAASQVEGHLAECAACRNEFNMLKGSLGAFRDSLHRMAADSCPPTAQILPNAPPAPLPAWRHMGSLLSAACLVCAVVAVISFHREPAPQSAASPNAVDDRALLQSVSEGVSGSLPTAFSPLQVPLTRRP